jgi:hypothetical protein
LVFDGKYAVGLINSMRFTTHEWSSMTVVCAAALQVLYIPLSTQTSMPWWRSPMMRDGIYVPLLYVTFIPGAAQPDGLNNVYTSKWLFLAAALFAVVMVSCASIIASE